MTNKEIIEQIREYRSSNNSLWMHLLEIAIVSKPDLTKEILRDINRNDRAVSDLLEKLAK